jgi:peptide/nickel transport system substrate-binding protein
MRPIGGARGPFRDGLGPLLLGILVVVIISGAATWILVGDTLTGSGEDERERFTEAVAGSPSRVNPLFAHLNDVDRDLVSLVFSGLTRISEDGSVLPDLAEGWEIGADGRTVTFHLRSGITFHTGSPLTSDDVIYTYSLLGDPALQGDPEQAPLWRQVHCSNPDALTVVCELPAPFAPFLAYASIGILPKTVLAGVDAATILDGPFNQSPVGTGPYRLAQLDRSQALLRAHTEYHLGAPKIGEIELQFAADTAGAAATVIRGDADAILVGSSAGEEELDELGSTSGLNVYSANRTAYTALYLNNSAAPLNDQAVRAAIAQAVDIDSILAEVVGPLSSRASSPMAPGTWAFDPAIEVYEHDDDDARDVLESDGWMLPEGGEVRIKNDSALTITLMTDQDPVRTALAEQVAKELEAVGVGVTVTLQDSAVLVRDYLVPREYQAAIFGWDQGLDPDPYPAWHSSQAATNGHNLADYQSEDADALMEEGRRSFDLEQRQGLYFTFQQIFHDDTPTLILYYPVYNYYVRDRVEGIEIGTLFHTSSRYRNVHEWTLEEGAAIIGE